MFCHQCGTKLEDDAAFCFQCGTKMEVDESTEVTVNSEPAYVTESVSEPAQEEAATPIQPTSAPQVARPVQPISEPQAATLVKQMPTPQVVTPVQPTPTPQVVTPTPQVAPVQPTPVQTTPAYSTPVQTAGIQTQAPGTGQSISPYDKPMTILGWIGTFIVLAIPIVNFVMFFVWCFGSNVNKSKKTYLQAALILFMIMTVLGIIFGATIAAIIGPAIQDAMNTL